MGVELQEQQKILDEATKKVDALLVDLEKEQKAGQQKESECNTV